MFLTILLQYYYINREMKRLERLWTLFITTFTISMTANSGYAILSVMKNVFVQKHKWFTEEEMNDCIAMAQSAPGPMGINGSMIVGYQLEGALGAFAAVLGCCLPPIVIMILVTYFYQTIVTNEYVRVFMRGMQAGVGAMLIDVVIGLFTNVMKSKSWFPYVIMIISFCFIRYTSLSVFYLVVFCIIASLLKTAFIRRRAGGE